MHLSMQASPRWHFAKRAAVALTLMVMAYAAATALGGTGTALALPCPTCYPVPVPPPPPPPPPSISPTLSVDLARQTVDRGAVHVVGWAADGDSPLTPLTVRISVDGGPATTTTANVSRPDVATAFPKFGATHGYDVTVPASANPQQVCVTAVNVGSGSDTKACHQVDDMTEFDAGGITYDTANASITGTHLDELDQVTNTNLTSVQQSTTISGSKTVTDTEGWSDSLGLKVTVSGGVSIPLIADGKVSVEGSATFTQNGSTSTGRTFTWQQPVLVPAKSQVVATVAVTQSTLTVPYSMSGNYVYGSGAKVSGTITGTYSGTNSHNLEVDLTQLNLNGTAAAHPVQQPKAKILKSS
jgi:hypothetical protein